MPIPANPPRTPPAIAPPFVVEPVFELRALADTVTAAPVSTEVGVTERKELEMVVIGVVFTAIVVCADVYGEGQLAAANNADSGHTKDAVVETLLLVEVVLEVEAELEEEVAVDEVEVVFVDAAEDEVEVVLASVEDVVGGGCVELVVAVV